MMWMAIIIMLVRGYVDLSEFGGPPHAQHQELWYDTYLDYTGQLDDGNKTFKMRYLIDDQFFKP